jgi:hypothetical protein
MFYYRSEYLSARGKDFVNTQREERTVFKHTSLYLPFIQISRDPLGMHYIRRRIDIVNFENTLRVELMNI